jgi:hypothetical protein
LHPSGIRATRENRKTAASRERKKVREPAKKKLPEIASDHANESTGIIAGVI